MKRIFFAVLALLMLTAMTADRPVTIFIIGDSTAAKKDLSKGSPEQGGAWPCSNTSTAGMSWLTTTP